MSLRDEFEKLCPVPDGVRTDENGGYIASNDAAYDMARNHNAMYQGFLLGRRNTVSVERYKQHVDDAFYEGMRQTPWENSQAKRRTEEV